VVESAMVGGISAPVRLLQECDRSAARVLQGYHKCLISVLQECCKGAVMSKVLC
jgi:hypothetical protein